MDFKVGDVVRLKSGGPEMTVYSVRPAGVVVGWFDANEICQRCFDPDTLKSAESADQTTIQSATDEMNRRKVEEAAKRGFNS